MARVSQAHLDARRRQILDAARRCFVRNGFHATTMQDILREADLSSGAVYRYFRSKEEIIVAIAKDVLATMGRAIVEALPADANLTAVDLLGHLFTRLEEIDTDQEIARMAVQVWSEAVRSPVIGAEAPKVIGELIDLLASRIETYQQQGSIRRYMPSRQMAQVIFSMLPGFLLQRALLDNVTARMFHEAFAAMLAPEPAAPDRETPSYRLLE